MGMTGFDSVTPRVTHLLFGLVPVPDTHMVHTIPADRKIASLADYAEGIAARVFGQPAYALAA